MNNIRYRIRVNGLVQGVGFRPYLHRRAMSAHLSGWARNTGYGVEMELEGEKDSLNRLCEELRRGIGIPPLASVDDVIVEEIPVTGVRAGFEIRKSRDGGHETLVAPDAGMCPDCRRELFDPADRRWRYPFLNCTNCGPRFSIVQGVPYDREKTTMREYPMCPECAAEYHDIKDRRYHAQPNCCPNCGPRVWFAGKDGAEQEGDAFLQAKQLLDAGGILAVKGIGGFHLACRIDRTETVHRLRRLKHRPNRPLAIMCADLEAAAELCRIDNAEREQIESIRRPIVLLEKYIPDSYPELSETTQLGIMLPYTPVHELLFAPMPDGTYAERALVMTSANYSDQPAIITNDAAKEQLSDIADGFLFHNRKIATRCDDSLISLEQGNVSFVRRSRGFAPRPLELPFSTDGLLACGAEQKASFAYGKGTQVYYSQHIGDLKNAETLQFYTAQMEAYAEMYECTPRRILCDLHPDYLSTRFAQQKAMANRIPVIPVQHHHAHMASCMAEHGLEGPCIGLIWDGTGLGTDGSIWGSETLVGDYRSFDRIASLQGIKLFGGDAAVMEIERIAYALLLSAGIPERTNLTKEYANLFCAMDNAGLNTPISHGMGRLFDGIYALITGTKRVTYEGEGAVLLETLARQADSNRETYELPLVIEEGLYRSDTDHLVRQLMSDSDTMENKAGKFHNALIQFAGDCCSAARDVSGVDRVVLSGGVFLNRILRTGIADRLTDLGFEVYMHSKLSPGDEGIALGQLAIGAHLETED